MDAPRHMLKCVAFRVPAQSDAPAQSSACRAQCCAQRRGSPVPACKSTDRATWFKVTLVTLAGSFLLSNLIPNLGLLISVIGATAGVVLTFLFPAAAAIWGKGRHLASGAQSGAGGEQARINATGRSGAVRLSGTDTGCARDNVVAGHKVVFGLAVMVLLAGTYSTVRKLVEGIAASKPPFTC